MVGYALTLVYSQFLNSSSSPLAFGGPSSGFISALVTNPAISFVLGHGSGLRLVGHRWQSRQPESRITAAALVIFGYWRPCERLTVLFVAEMLWLECLSSAERLLDA